MGSTSCYFIEFTDPMTSRGAYIGEVRFSEPIGTSEVCTHILDKDYSSIINLLTSAILLLYGEYVAI